MCRMTWITFFLLWQFVTISSQQCISVNHGEDYNKQLNYLSKNFIPKLQDENNKGNQGLIGIIGGSTSHAGETYFAALAALKVGADVVYVLTTEDSATIIKSYSPDIMVYPILDRKYLPKINYLINIMDVIVLGPGMANDEEISYIIEVIIATCKKLKKPLLVDGDALSTINSNISLLSNFPNPGLILTPNKIEEWKLSESMKSNHDQCSNGVCDNIAALIKGREDAFISSVQFYNWINPDGGSNRRVAGQGSFLVGSLATFYYWALNLNICESEDKFRLAQSIATYAASKFTRKCNGISYAKKKRHFLVSDMLDEIPEAFNQIF